jgi:hypothetical protein
MESFTLTAASGWQTLQSLLSADVTFTAKYLWCMLSIKNTHASQTMIIKNLPGATAPVSDSGINLAAGASFAWDGGNQGIIDGKSIWIKASGAGTTFDITFLRKSGI